MSRLQPHILWFKTLGLNDVAQVGGKNASLGEMYQKLTGEGIRVPNGFAVTSDAYRYVLEHNNAWAPLHAALDGLDPDDIKDLQARGKRARAVVYGCTLPDDLKAAILQGYAELQHEYGNSLSLAVRSSATAEDSPQASFAGQNETYLNIAGEEALLDAYKRCLASNFTDRSIHYKFDNGFDCFKVDLAVVVMKMVRSDLGASGVMFSLDTETGFKDVVFINATWGLGENVVQGTVAPDSFYVHKPSFVAGYRAVLKRSLGSKEKKMVFTDTLNTGNIAQEYTANIDTPSEEQTRFCLSDADVMVLADYAIKVENHYSSNAGAYKPMDMEWAKDGIDGQLYMVQARPETVASQKKGNVLQIYHLKQRSPVLLRGKAVGTRIGAGIARVVNDVKQLSAFQPGEVLVSEATTPDWEPVMKTAAAIVTNRGGRTCHAAIVARELGIPAIVGAADAAALIKTGTSLTVSCAEGENGTVYEGILEFEVEDTDLSQLGHPDTHIMMNLANPDRAFSLASLPVDGIGLARMEFIINECIKIHPMALVHPEKLDDATRQQIAVLSTAYKDPTDFFIKTLAEGVATIAAAVYPKPCVVRMSDFKSNEYATLLGGQYFEPAEHNPMIGFRGASRYSHPAYAEGFALECAAMKWAREHIGLTNIKLMIPFCRTVAEGERVLATMASHGLQRGENGLEVYIMCEIPNNVIQIDAFAKLFDGFSIGSNDLTQLTLGVDRDSDIVAFDFDERDPGVKQMIRLAVEGAKRNGRHSGICGQAPSDYPEMAEYLVSIGIDSMSLSPDAVLATIRHVLAVQKSLLSSDGRS
ncbi:phosphoenolpyruvate synthase [Pseudomonas extremaustralis]|uniref:Phosphoenolpyruvate synthase n=1 Tax=Pseudomonas extremaustralis TaxID=359110 RepID=A0A5C5QPG6_9PSED|nr:phosphoenolpyruvate synthase [Pseudomonas extremaustralis]EZI30095.1 phosphoenolpyruvate synthase [Pseudomonas extremaustralis 14-3 substr. 14-3b]TWS07385.1 phosphoenolpyruvate synthase [Pseudomonas extremaustralis]SDE97099.1 phosphoenolpyruvate synthase [Pseudomonas extremaustralis]